MTRVLFVDDEPRILDGLQRMLRGRRREWEMTFAPGGGAAMEELRRGPVDVVVTDMRMPGMDGVDLLTRVQEIHPQTLRIVLSGHTEAAVAARAARVAHQFISKPSNPDVVRGVVERICALAAPIPTEARVLVGRIGAIPVCPRAYERLTVALNVPDPSPEELTDIISQEPGIAAKLLQVVNSSFFGISPQVSDLAMAVRLLTPATLRELVFSSGIFRPMDPHDPRYDALKEVQAHAVCVANLVARSASGAAGSAYTAGLLHDLGKRILLEALPDRYAAIADDARERGVPLHAAEEAAFGTTHAEIGGYLLGIWNLPAEIVEAVARHHQAVDEPAGSAGLATAIRAAHP